MDEICVVSAIKCNKKRVWVSADLDCREIETNYLVAAYAIRAVPAWPAEEINASGIIRATGIAVLRRTGDADYQCCTPDPSSNGRWRWLCQDEKVRIAREP